MQIKIETSARHIHLTAEDFKSLFGDKNPVEIKELSQGDKACEEVVTITGPKSSLSNVRLITPFREKSQVEISRTDCFALGVEAPLKVSGDSPGASIKVAGPAGNFESEIAIVAKRHLHINTEEAVKIGLSNSDSVEVKIAGERVLLFSNIVVRIKDTYSTALHLDTDEANAAGLSGEATGELIHSS